ncbi:MAG: proprotein convertase P-domain-containing protein, partial [Deltaproteobacteria bacterium]|nr:proprotein convertase P-domain-containing protein [Deltaproteobacteria bacterium]
GSSGTVTVVDTITVTADGNIEDLDVSIDISHTWNADIEVSLTSPAGTTADLFTNVGGSDDDMDIVLDDESSNTLPSSNATLSGDYQPEDEPLSLFDGEVAAGVWTITVLDSADGDGGTLNDWGLTFNIESAPGESEGCALQSCAEVIASNPAATDGDYWLDPGYLGLPLESNCDMSTDNGGWTLVYDFDRVSNGDGTTEFEAGFDTFVNEMGVYYEETNNIRWEDGNFSYDSMKGTVDVDVPNDGEVLHAIYYHGQSMEGSGTWFSVETVGGDENLYCIDDASNYGGFSSTDLLRIPGYTCGSFVSTQTYNPGTVQVDFGSEVTGVEFTTLHSDSGSGDYSRLYRYQVWVR